MTNQFPNAIPVAAETDEEWLAARRTFCGASESPALLGVGYSGSSRVGVWNAKVHGASDFSAGGDPELVERLKIGKLIEPALRDMFADHTGLQCVAPAARAYRARSIPCAGASLDGEALDVPPVGRVPVELKNVGLHNAHEWAGSDPPLKYQVQVQHQLLVTGAKLGYLFGLIGGQERVLFKIERDEQFLAELVLVLAEFWRSVETKTPPPFDATAGTAAALKTLYPKDTGATIELPPEALEWVQRREAAQAAIKTGEAEKLAAENLLKAAMGEAATGVLPGGRKVTWKTQSNKGYTVEPFEARVFRIQKG